MSTIAVIDYGMGNLRSVSKALEHVAPNHQIIVTGKASTILDADRVLLPGVGALRDCMVELQKSGLDKVVREVAASGRPLFGICLGMQALLDHSEENGGIDGLGVLPGKVVRFPEGLVDNGELLKVPHMGWNQVHQLTDHPMWHGIEQESRFYFVHSYYVVPGDADHSAASTRYGIEFISGVMSANVFAVQFHPEKSQQAGLSLLRNFAVWNGNL